MVTDPDMFKKHNATCDSCRQLIRGIRYKCMHPECPDYDLCDKCEALPIQVHPSNHPMLKMRCPSTVIPTVYRVGGTQLIPEPIFTIPTPIVETTGVAVETEPLPDASVSVEKPDTHDAAIATTSESTEPTFIGLEKSVEMPALPTPPPHIPGSLFGDPPSLIGGFPGRYTDQNKADGPSEMVQMSSNVPSLIKTFLDKYPPVQGAGLRASFVSDNNIEDGQAFPAGAEFIKSWRMRNDGDVAWPETTEVSFVAGDRMPAFEHAPLRYFVGRVESGEFVDVYAADMKAPEIPGKYIGYWRLTDGSRPFGQSVWCE